MKEEFVTYEQALALKELEFNEPCIYAWCVTPKHRIKYDGEVYLKTDGNPFGEFYNGKDFNSLSNAKTNKILCSAPLKQQVFRWFREKYKIFCYPDPTGSWRYSCKYRLEDKQSKHWVGYMKDKDGNILNTYEEAESACIDKLIELAKQQKL